MKLDFDGFMIYKSMHTDEMVEEITSSMQNEWSEGISLTQEDIALITKISLRSTYAVLRQYHEWLHSQT